MLYFIVGVSRMSIYRREHKGFTLTEIMVVTTIITLIIGVAVPNFLRMKASASQTAAIKALRTLSSAFEEFWMDQNPHHYPTNLQELDAIPGVQGSPQYVDSRITDNNRYQGYYFSVVTPDTETYSIQATPINTTLSGSIIYAVATSGTISGGILVCPGGNTGYGFSELTTDMAPDPDPDKKFYLPTGHPKTSGEIPPLGV